MNHLNGYATQAIRAFFLLWLTSPRGQLPEPWPIHSIRIDNGQLKTADLNGKPITFYRYRRHNKDRSIAINPKLIPTVERAIKQGLSTQAILSIYRSELTKINPHSRQLKSRKK